MTIIVMGILYMCGSALCLVGLVALALGYNWLERILG